MLRLNRDSRRLLDLIIATPPMIQGVAYDFCQMQELSGLPYLEYKETVTYLAQLGAIDLDPRMNYYRLTTVGRHYREFSGIEFRECFRHDFSHKFTKAAVIPLTATTITHSRTFRQLTWVLRRSGAFALIMLIPPFHLVQITIQDTPGGVQIVISHLGGNLFPAQRGML